MRLLPEREEKLWGQAHKVQHCYIDGIIGDGEILLCLETLNDRPACYAIWVDSFYKKMDEDQEIELIEHEVIDAIIEECGIVTDCYDDDECPEGCSCRVWPAVNYDCGYTWGNWEESWEFYETCKEFKSISKAAECQEAGQ